MNENTPPIMATYTRCGQTCMAEIDLKVDVLQIVRSQAKPEPGRLEFEDGAQHKIALPVSFEGLAAVLAARDN